MGKTIKKNQQARVRKTSTSGAFVVKGRKFELAECNPSNIAEFLRERRYPVGTAVKFRGGTYVLSAEDGADGTRSKLVQQREAL